MPGAAEERDARMRGCQENDTAGLGLAIFENKANRECKWQAIDNKKSVVKLLRVYGGCLGVQSLRRTWLGCDKLRGVAKQTVIRRSPRSGNRPRFISWKCLCKQAQGTQGTETSQYLQEDKETSNPQVAASERGRA
jgi:hypothetical protein